MAQPQEIRITLDGREVTTGPQEAVLTAARRLGVEIPTLCHHDAVKPYGACRLCLVEVFWGKRSKLVTACIYTAQQGDRIETGSDRVRRARRQVLELLLARCPQAEEVVGLAREYGVEQPRFPAPSGTATPRDERCILCGLCVRVCEEVVGQSAIGFANRGPDRTVSSPFRDQSEDCIGCGACVFVCPTGALHYEDRGAWRVMKELNTRIPLVECCMCGRPFATAQEIAKASERLKLPEEVAQACPRCRGAHFRAVMEKALAGQGSRGKVAALHRGSK